MNLLLPVCFQLVKQSLKLNFNRRLHSTRGQTPLLHHILHDVHEVCE